MSQAPEETGAAAPMAPAQPALPATTGDKTDRPIPLWPEGVLVAAATATLVVIGLRHRTYLHRKYTECRRAVEEFQRQGGLDDLQAVARQASDLLRGQG